MKEFRSSQRAIGRRQLLVIGLGVALLALFLCLIASIGIGSVQIAPRDIYTAFTAFDGSTEHLIVRTVRLPRSLVAAIVGAALAVAGAIMQGITRNPLASPTIVGVNAGAALAVVAATFIFGSHSANLYTVIAFVGAGIAAITCYFLSALGRGGVTPLNLTLAGAAVEAFVSSITSGMLIVSQRTLDEIRFWLAGSVAGRDLALVAQVLPYLTVGFLLAFALGQQITTLSLGEDAAKGLGVQTAWVKIGAGLSVILLAGASVALAGPIGFVGLTVPHFTRVLVGVDYRWILPYAAILGSILLLIADICSRVLLQPQELPVGLVMPLIGAPVFIYLIRSKIGR